MRARVTEVESLAPRVKQITLTLPEDVTFFPGQYLTFRFPSGTSRAYSIASAPERPEAVQLCIRLGDGAGSRAVDALRVNEQVEVTGPFGDFRMPGDAGDIVLIAGDVGIAPVRSIVLHRLAVKMPGSITVLYEPEGDDVLYAADFEPLDIQYERGRIEDLIERHRGAIDRSTVMIAGYDPFLLRVEQAVGLNVWEHAVIESFGAL